MEKKNKLKKTYNKIRLLSLATPSLRKQLVNKANRELIDSVCECCDNILKGRVPLKKKEKLKLAKHKNKLRALVRKKVSLEKKKKIIQSGGFLTSLLVPAVSFLGGLLSSKALQ